MLPGTRGRSASLRQAALHDRKGIVQSLLADGTDVNAMDAYGLTPAHLAASMGFRDTLELLLARGADVHARDIHGLALVHLAASRGHEPVAALLLAHGADVNARDRMGSTPLHVAATRDMAALLVASGADVGARNRWGRTPLHSMAFLGRTDVVALLLENGAEPGTRDGQGGEPLHVAALQGHWNVVERLLARGANANARDWHGETPLHKAAMRNSTTAAAALLAKDAYIDARDVRGTTPLHMAAWRGYKAMVELLLAREADTTIRDHEGRMPWQSALAGRHEELSKLLRADAHARRRGRAAPTEPTGQVRKPGLPLFQAAHSRHAARSGPVEGGARWSTPIARRVLVVDDEPVVNQGCSRVLGAEGYDVATTESGEDGLRRARAQHYDLVITDLKMPDLDGMDLVREIRRERPDTRIVIITAYGTPSSELEAVRLGVSDYIEKPFTPRQLSDAVDKALTAVTCKGNVTGEAEIVRAVLRRAAIDPCFASDLMRKPHHILARLAISPEAKAAVACGDADWIEDHYGELSRRERQWLDQRAQAATS